MKRKISDELMKWKKTPIRKPIILRGARQVGKTTAVRELGSSFSNFIELNFEENPELSSFFDGSLDPYIIVNNLENYLRTKISSESTLLFLDEIQYAPRALMSLRYFYEKMPKLHVIAAGSLIEFELEKISFPVGRVEFFHMYPMDFREFLTAIEKEQLLDYSLQPEIPEAIHNQLLDLLRDYTIIGGMPEVVKQYVEHRNFDECRNIQSSIIETFTADFPKYSKKTDIKYITTMFNAVPLQLGRKLKYSNVSNLYQPRELGRALDLLEKAGLMLRVYHSSSNGIPLESEKNFKKFKVIFFDTGLALRLLRIPTKELLLNNDISLINEGAIAEQLIGQELLARSPLRERPRLYYWHREAKSSNAELDYIIVNEDGIIPLEIKSGPGGTLKSLKIFIGEKTAPYGICLAKTGYSELDKIKFAPLYSVGRFLQD